MSATTSNIEARSKLAGPQASSLESEPVRHVPLNSVQASPFQITKPVKWLNLLKCLGLLAATSYLDYAIGYQKSFFVFYLVPIAISLWLVGFRFAVVMCALSATVWLANNMLAGQVYHDLFMPIWNMTVRFCIFLLVAGLLAVRGKLKNQVQQSRNALSEEVQKRIRLEKEVLEASEREQQRIGQDLHDSLCQHLTATALAAKVLAKKLAAQSRPEAAEANHLAGLVGQGIEFTRTLARSLHPIELHAEGLVDGLRELAANVSRGFSVNCKLECTEMVSLPTAGANLHLYRIAQEAISNAIRHGHAKNIIVRMETALNKVVLTVTDDGAGLPANARDKGGMGFHTMNYRAGMTGGELQITSLPSGGTRVACIVPETAPFPSKEDAQPR